MNFIKKIGDSPDAKDAEEALAVLRAWAETADPVEVARLDPAIARLPLACRRLDGRDARYHRAAAALARQSPAPALPRALWARRSVFLLRGRALMVSEAFLPAILELRK